MRRKGLPEWVCGIVTGFLTERTTSLRFSGYTSTCQTVTSGIPQGSLLSPILFLLIASELLEGFQGQESLLGLGFVDNTNLVTWGPSAQANCRTLERAHEKCLQWATRHGASFAPDKYQLIHFTRRRSTEVDAVINIPGFQGEPVQNLRVLGVWVDNKLR